MKVFLFVALAKDFNFWFFFGISMAKGGYGFSSRSNKTRIGSYDPEVPDGMDDFKEASGTGSVFIFLAMFGGSTFILFLLCYFCQKKLQYGDDLPVATDCSSASRQVFVIPARPNQQTFRSVNGELSTSTPPPDYRAVVKKDCVYHDDPPTYEVAVFGNSSIKEQQQQPQQISS